MTVIPAIDIKNGKCVRLLQGDPDKETIYSESPVDQAKIWEDSGATLIHIVDLDGAFDGIPVNLKLIEQIQKNVSIDIEVGGGIRDMSILKEYINIGIKRIIVGSSAYNDRDFIKTACKTYPDNIIVGIDVVNNHVAIHGWKKVTDTHLYDFGREMKQYGVSELIITDIERDGMLEGISKDFYEKALQEIELPIIASGGVTTIDDIINLLPLKDKGLKGIITGKALYEKRINLKEALEVVHAG